MHLHSNRIILSAVLPLLLLTSVLAFARTTYADSPADGLPGLEHSWRYDNGKPIPDPDTDNLVTDAGGGVEPWVQLLDAENFRVRKNGNVYTGTFGGGTMTVTDAKAFGVDVSMHNGTIDWAKAKADGVDFAILRLGWGSYGEHGAQNLPSTDITFLQNYEGAKAQGIKVGVYLYSYAGWTGFQSLSFWKDYAALEAEHVLTVLGNAGIDPSDLDYPVYYDMEESYLTNSTLHYADQSVSNRTFLTDISKIFCNRIEQAGYDAGIYSSLSWWNNLLTDPVFENWERWVAQWPASGMPNQSTDYKGAYGLWQAHSEAYVEGIGTCDINFDYLDRTKGGTSQPGDPGSSEKPGDPGSSEKPADPGSSEKPADPGTTEQPVNKYPANSMVRLYNPYTGVHHFTMDQAEARNLAANGWRDEGVAWTSPTSGAPVYRLYNPYSGDHHFTMDPFEREGLAKSGWNDEGFAFYCGGKTPVYRLYNPSLTEGTHHYVTSVQERQSLEREGWIYEAIGFIGV